jgi:pimeloyl-ACP methyl ester carboxylesterase
MTATPDRLGQPSERAGTSEPAGGTCSSRPHHRRQLPFFSQGHRIDADLHLPAQASAWPPYPVVIACSGFEGRKQIHPERFARALTPLGHAVLAFDYRGFGVSEGEYGRVVPQEWAEDVRAAVDRLMTEPDADPRRIGLVGWGLGGGVVVAEAAEDARIDSVAVVNGMASGTRCFRHLHDDASWRQLQARIVADRTQRASGARSELVSAWEIVPLDFDRATERYVDSTPAMTRAFGPITLESADMLLRFCPEAVVGRVSPRPLLIVHGSRNQLHLPEEARALYDQAGQPKQLVFLDAGHTEWMEDGHPTFQSLAHLLSAFFAGMPQTAS